jgi:hypothetical protein
MNTTVNVDLGVQFVCKLLYPNLQRMLERAEFKASVFLDDHPALNVGVTIDQAINWGNFPAYQDTRNPLFAFFTPALAAEMARFELAVLESIPHASMTLSAYFAEQKAKGTPYSDAFIDYALLPYLSILNGYGGTNLLIDSNFEELIPLFGSGLASFASPGKGWQRFRNGSSTWIDAMRRFAIGQGRTTIYAPATVTAAYPSTTAPGKTTVEWKDADGQKKLSLFDRVVFTTDMDTNRQILENPRNGYWRYQERILSQFQLNPGSCYIHTDDSVFPTYLKTRTGADLRASTTDFCAAYTKPEPGKTPPYDMAHAYSTYNIKNMAPDVPGNLYLTMYGNDVPEHAPDPKKTFVKQTWKHGSFLGPQLRNAAKQVHQIQGMGNMWFAGNNTCIDAEEGALISAMVIAGKLFPEWTYPFPFFSEAEVMYLAIKDGIMFPPSFARSLTSWDDWEKRRTDSAR